MHTADQDGKGTSNVAVHIVNREFKRGPRKVLLTDITYLFYTNGKCYLSTIPDDFTHEISAYRVSLNFRRILSWKL